MNTHSPLSAEKRYAAYAGFVLLLVGGLGFFLSAVVGASHGLKAWLLPFGPWACALILYGVLRRTKRG